MSRRFATLLPDAWRAHSHIVTMLGLHAALQFEVYPGQTARRFPFDAAFRAQRLCRHLLNVVASLIILNDSHEVRGDGLACGQVWMGMWGAG